VKTISPVAGDFNLDGKRTAADVPVMAAALANLSKYESTHGMNDAYLKFIGDLNNDGKVDAADYNLLCQIEFQSLPGDTNGDGVVNFADYQLIEANWSQQGQNLPGDLNGDGVVDFADFQLLQLNYGNSVSSSNGSLNSVPEPAAWVPAVFGGIMLLLQRRWAANKTAQRKYA
jgi:hypothetical protein